MRSSSFALALLAAIAAAAGDEPAETPEYTRMVKTTCVELYFSPYCPHCVRTVPVVDALEAKHKPYLVLHRINVVAHGWGVLETAFKVRNKKGSSGVPAAFVGNVSVLGEHEIKNNLERVIFSHQGSKCTDTVTVKAHKPTPVKDEPKNKQPEQPVLVPEPTADAVVVDTTQPTSGAGHTGFKILLLVAALCGVLMLARSYVRSGKPVASDADEGKSFV
eukprot:m51a1_g5701 hypothetical protein (219) ;mRNA; r:1032436-1033328